MFSPEGTLPIESPLSISEQGELQEALLKALSLYLEACEETYFVNPASVSGKPINKQRYQAFETWLAEALTDAALPTNKHGSYREHLIDINKVVEIYGHLHELKTRGTFAAAERQKYEQDALLNEAIRVLGRENVHGVEDIEAAFGFTIEHRRLIPPIPYSLAELRKSTEIYEKTGVQEMLVLFPLTDMGRAMTGEDLNYYFSNRFRALGLGSFLRGLKSNGATSEGGWYKDQSFYLEPNPYLPRGYVWRLIGKTPIPMSLGKCHSAWMEGTENRPRSQDDAIKDFGNQLNIPWQYLRRCEIFELLEAVTIHFCVSTIEARKKEGLNGIGERLLTEYGHWSNTSVDGGFALVNTDQRGSSLIIRRPEDEPISNLGVYLTRAPAWEPPPLC